MIHRTISIGFASLVNRLLWVACGVLVFATIGCRGPRSFDPERMDVRPAEGSPGRVEIRWQTESETNSFGFYIQRASAEDGPFERIGRLIPGSGTTHVPNRYQMIDQPLPVGQTYYYRIEQLDLDGNTRIISPVRSVQVEMPAEDRYLESEPLE